ncbi:Uroporphyrinogen-III C-methyltransferase [Botrimarina hoheduenensis]|uniref:uroporphyrinogen-III C-methyltransferase n=1 Tax=Botrimarina hoheduenensis TaxID=2528000 RepID=A0A5C5VSF5_9BACT|nr:Uroporphyrinogen-III C-methyltransferase [Botrimarina hoheduenensis]
MNRPGKVYLVGAGPGDPELLTLRGRRRLAAADVVLHDYLASEQLLRHAPLHAERVCFGSSHRGKTWTQTQINERMVSEALSGKTVVRLKGGDPSIFGRLAEEVEACRQAGLAFEVVPGVTTATAAGAYSGVTLTDRDKASCVTFITGQEQPRKPEDQTLDFGALAATPGTLVLYMAAANAAGWSGRLLEAGKPAQTPVAIIRRCSLPDQTTRLTTLGEIAGIADQEGLRPPLIAIIGEVARETAVSAWFTHRPLFGQTVVVTRPADQSEAMADRLRDAGARVLLQPTITIGPPDSWAAVDVAIDRLGKADFVVFSSRNGVEAFLSRMRHRGIDARGFGAARIAAIGPATAASLAEWRLRADLAPSEYRAEALAAELAPQVSGKQVLLVRASRGREVLAEELAKAGAIVEQVVAYHSSDIVSADDEVLTELAAGRVDWITATSSAIARAAARLLGEAIEQGRGVGKPARFAAISPLTAEALAAAGQHAEAIAEVYTADGVVDAILAATGGGTG